MSKKTVSYILMGILAAVVLTVLIGGIGKNDAQNWQLIQYPTGKLAIRDNPGFYFRCFATVWTYQRYLEFRYNDDPAEGAKADERIKVTFNDGGTADVSTFVRLATPTLKADRIEFHRQFGGNKDNVKASIKAHMTNCLKTTAPLMSSSEHQSARKSEFSLITEDQLSSGLYASRKVEKELKDRFDDSGQPIMVYATEILQDKDGNPKVAQVSPLITKFKLTVDQFSVTGTLYDPETLKQFAAKKSSFLAAEKSKAEREQMVQERLKIEEQGLRDKASAEAVANVAKATAVIAAQLKAEVAQQVKLERETQANMGLEIEKIAKIEAETKAAKLLAVATLGAKAAAQTKQATILIAEGRKEAIEKSGAITEFQQAMIDAKVQMADKVSQALAQIQVPTVMFMGGGSDGGSNLTENLINLRLMEATGIFDVTNVRSIDVKTPAAPSRN